MESRPARGAGGDGKISADLRGRVCVRAESDGHPALPQYGQDRSRRVDLVYGLAQSGRVDLGQDAAPGHLLRHVPYLGVQRACGPMSELLDQVEVPQDREYAQAGRLREQRV